MMSIMEFTEKMKAEVREYLPTDIEQDIIIDDVTVVKMNDQKLHGLMFKLPGRDKSPTLYVDEMYQRYVDGNDIGQLAENMADNYLRSTNAPIPPKFSLEYEDVKEKLSVRLLEKKRNCEFLTKTPYASVGNGFVLVADINIGGDRQDGWSAIINNSMMETIGVDKETLFADAMKNTCVLDPPVLEDMSNIMQSFEMANLFDRDEPIAPDDVGNMYVLTNESQLYGAAVLFYPDVMEKVTELIDEGYYILPSSVHELILVPESTGISEKELCNMVRKANREVVEAKDILSDDVLHYCRGNRKLEKVSADRTLGDRVAEAR